MSQPTTRNRQQLTAIFTDPASVWFVHGIWLCHGISEVKLTFWKTGKTRNVMSFRRGLRDGVSVSYTPAGEVSSYRNYRAGEPWGEAAVYAPQGGVKKHVLADGVSEVLYSENEAVKFGGYLMDDAKEGLGQKYRKFGPGRWYG